MPMYAYNYVYARMCTLLSTHACALYVCTCERSGVLLAFVNCFETLHIFYV